MKRMNIKCPYCGSQALLRPASVVYGSKAADPAAPYYVCARFPGCDSYVAAHRDTRSPTLAHTHFHDCELSYVLLQKAMMKNCDTIDCTVDNADYAGAVLDGCSFGRITAGTIRLDYATITQSGATEEECRQNREAIYKALGIKEAAA